MSLILPNHSSNCAIYYARQIWFKAKRYITKFELDSEMKLNPIFKRFILKWHNSYVAVFMNHLPPSSNLMLCINVVN
jgi:hypothetical protein